MFSEICFEREKEARVIMVECFGLENLEGLEGEVN